MDKKVLDIRVRECRTSRPTSGHSNRGNKSFSRRDSLRTNSLFTDGDLHTHHTRKNHHRRRIKCYLVALSLKHTHTNTPAVTLLLPAAAVHRTGGAADSAHWDFSPAQLFTCYTPLESITQPALHEVDMMWIIDCLCEHLVWGET